MYIKSYFFNWGKKYGGVLFFLKNDAEECHLDYSHKNEEHFDMKTVGKILIFSLLSLGCNASIQAKTSQAKQTEQKDVTTKPEWWNDKTKTIVWGSAAGVALLALVYVTVNTIRKGRAV